MGAKISHCRQESAKAAHCPRYSMLWRRTASFGECGGHHPRRRRGHADDTAAVLVDLAREAPAISNVFAALATASGLHLNVSKCLCIPLHLRPQATVAEELAAAVPAWGGMKIATSGTYLGFAVGPGKANRSWEAALTKATARVRQWEWGQLGLFFATQVWNTYIIPILTFVAQLEQPPPGVAEAMHKMLRTAAHGPGNWFRPDDVLRLRRSYGFAGEFKDIQTVAMATRFRTAWQEDRGSGGLHAIRRAASIRKMFTDSQQVARCGTWAAWFQSFVLQNLANTLTAAKEQHAVTPPELEKAAVQGGGRQERGGKKGGRR
jgi:hypothetical protein